MSAGTVRSELLRTRADRFSRALRGLGRGDVRALHRARVATRRLREILPVLCIGGVTVPKLIRRLKKTTSRLGTVRELDVLILLIDDLHDSRREHAAALGRVAMTVAKLRDDERKRLFGHASIRDLRRTARKLDDLVDELAGEAEQPAKAMRWAIEARVTRRAERLASALRKAGAVYLPERLHVVRIAAKKLRYSVELVAEITGSDRAADVRVLRATQDVLGRMHDSQMLIDRVRQVQATLAPPSINVWRALDALLQSLDDDCRRLHARYMRGRPKLDALIDRLSATDRATAVVAASPKTRAKRGAASLRERLATRAG
jgi:CHAD domain-containing protein